MSPAPSLHDRLLDRLRDRLGDRLVGRTLAQKPLATGPAPRPWTRGYQYRFEPDPLSRPID